MDRSAGLDDMEKRKFLIMPGLELRPSVIQHVPNGYTDCAIPATMFVGRI
jgi:hypothetical protein